MLFFCQTAIAQTPPPPAIPEAFKNYEFSYDGKAMPYRLLTPESTREDEKFPLIVGLHGAENFGADKGRFLQIAGAYALGWLAPAIQDKYPSYVLAPHIYYPLFLEEGYDGWDDEKSLGFLRQLIDHLLASEKIDPDRIYLTGHSMGGIGTFLMPKYLKDYFAALVPMNTAGGCPQVCEEVDDNLYDSLSIWGVHHRKDDANENVRQVFTRLETNGMEVYPTHSFGEEIINLPPKRIDELINEHQRYFHTEYRYSCNGDFFFCHTSSMDTIIQDTLFQKWLFRQHKIDPGAVEITSIAVNSNFTVNWEAKNPADSVEVWFRSEEDGKWLKLTKSIASKKSFDLLPSVARDEVSLNARVRLVVLNDNNFVYGFSESQITALVTSIPEHQNRRLVTYPNPATHTVFLKIPEGVAASGLKYRIISPRGSVVKSGRLAEDAIDVRGLTRGIYMMILESDTGYFRQKLAIAD